MPKTIKPPRRGELVSRQLHLDDHEVFARVFVAEGGGPIRTIITGRAHHATGRFVTVKAGHRALPWESRLGELPMLKLVEVASAVHTVMAQPHRLEMIVEGAAEPLIYFPDLHLQVDARFATALRRGMPFAKACSDWLPDPASEAETRELIVEIKTATDRRNGDPVYQAKLALAAEVYDRIGWQFIQVIDPTGEGYSRIAHAVHEIALDHDVVVEPFEVQQVLDLLSDGPKMLATVAEVLGGTVAAVQKASALHVRRLLCIDLAGRLAPDSMVYPMTAKGGSE